MAEKKKKHLHELLEDDQEPFHLHHYISNLRSQMGFAELRLKKRKSNTFSISNNNNVPTGFFSCENSCFLATTYYKSPDPRNSPLFELRSPANNKNRDGRVFLQIPTRTAAILLEAAARIQKQQSVNKTKKARTRGNGFGMFGSVLKRLKNRKQKPRLDNAVLLEPTSSGSRLGESFVEVGGDKCFCESPFHFVLETSPSSSGHQTPHFTSTATSPDRRTTEDEDSDKTESLEKVRGQEEEDKDEEDKEQCSPVSVLDPLEEEEADEDHHEHQHEPDHTCSFEAVQRAKRRLLKKLRRFEKLAGLDPVELEGKMSEEEEEEEEYDESEEDDTIRIYDSDEEYEDVDEAVARETGRVQEETRKKNVEGQKKWRMMNACRVGLGAEADVDAVVQKDMREEVGEWTKYSEEVEEAVSDLELSIFVFLIDEFSHELISSCP